MFCTFSHKALGQKNVIKRDPHASIHLFTHFLATNLCRPFELCYLFVFTTHSVRRTATFSMAFQDIRFDAEIPAIYVTIFGAHIVSLGRISAKILNYS